MYLNSVEDNAPINVKPYLSQYKDKWGLPGDSMQIWPREWAFKPMDFIVYSL